jgi:sec-independent protein translocase protein TatB
MFDIAWSELLLIAVVALIFIGPKELPHVLHSMGRMVTKIRRQADEFRRQFDDSVREAGYGDLHKNIQEFRSLNPVGQVKDTLVRAMTETPPAPAPAAPLEQAAFQPALAGAPASKEAAPEPQTAPPPQEPLSPARAELPATEMAASPPPPIANAHAAEADKNRIAPAA